MIQLNRSMMERYEITDRRPQTLRAAIFGADRLMLGAAARLLDRAGVGAVCVSRSAAALRAQDGMFTMLVRGEGENGSRIHEELVVQSIMEAVDPQDEFEAFLQYAVRPELEMLLLPAECDAVQLALAARFLYQRCRANLPAPALITLCEHACPANAQADHILALAAEWDRDAAFAAWLRSGSSVRLLAETLCGPLGGAELAKARHDMNYRDDFIAWAEPGLRCTPDAALPESLAGVCEAPAYDAACLKKARIFDALVFLCTASGVLSGMDSFAQTLKDERLRAWIGHAFYDEIMPGLDMDGEAAASAVISAFTRLENPMNDAPLLELGSGMMSGFARSLLPALRAYADREFEAPPRLSLAFTAAIMLCAGVRRDEQGAWRILRGDQSLVMHDDPEILTAFSRLSHDMPAESLAYAVLADRDIWGADLREIDGLEMRVAFDLSSIQRVGFRETLRMREEA